MTTNYQSDLGTSQAGDDGSSGAKEQAKQAAGSAVDQSKNVAGTAQEEAARVASEASSQLRGLLQQATSQVEEQSSEQKTRLAQTVRTFAEDLDSMHAEDQSSGLASQVVQEVAEQARSLASRLEDREPRELLEDVRRFARRRPGTFILGALAAGVITGRLTRAGKAAQDSGTSSTSSTTAIDRPSSVTTTTDSTLVAPVPPTDDAGSPAYLSDETGTDDIEILGTPAADARPGTTAGPGTGRS
jgi:uncharacterized protein YjbJ (UPF0337 family)